MEPIVRLACLDDLDDVLALYGHLVPDDPELDPARAMSIWADLISSDTTSVIVAELNRRVVSTCMLVVAPNLTRGGRSFAVVENVVTHPRFRNQGVATSVLRFATGEAFDRGCYKVMLSTGRKDEATLHFYESAGFTRGSKTFFEMRTR
jgi:ribosomal protein S18 acetylase RimI-like enzyme